MPEMLYYMRSNYQYWKDLEEKGTISFNDIWKVPKALPKIPESGGGNHWERRRIPVSGVPHYSITNYIRTCTYVYNKCVHERSVSCDPMRNVSSSTRFEMFSIFFLLHKDVHMVDFILFLYIHFLKIQYVINIFFHLYLRLKSNAHTVVVGLSVNKLAEL